MKKTSVSKFTKGLLAVAVAIALAPSAAKAGQQDDQIAFQLGAIALGYTVTSNGTGNGTLDTNALYQGRALLKSTARRAQTGIQNHPINTTDIQTQTLRSQILLATERALLNPVTAIINGSVVTTAGRTVNIRNARLDPKKTTASAIFAYTALRVPNFGPGLIAKTVDGAVANTAGVFKFNYRNADAVAADINRAASNAMNRSLRAYTAGTTNWAPYTLGGTLPQYLPNFSVNTNPRNNPAGQAPNVDGLANAAGAIAANASAALTDNLAIFNTPKTTQALAVQNLAAALVAGAARFQRTSVTGAGFLIGGSTAAVGFGLVTQYAGNNSASWTTAANNSILTAIIEGGVKGSKSNANSFAIGVASGFAATYLSTHGSTVDSAAFNTFKAAAASAIQASFVDGKYKVKLTDVLTSSINSGLDAAFAAYQANNWNAVSGAGGISTDVVNGVIKSLTFLNATGTPVSDTVGL